MNQLDKEITQLLQKYFKGVHAKVRQDNLLLDAEKGDQYRRLWGVRLLKDCKKAPIECN